MSTPKLKNGQKNLIGYVMIKIQNIYYMLSYAFKSLNEHGYQQCGEEKFENCSELFCALLTKGIETQLKRGLGKEYISKKESLNTPKGKISITESIKTQSFLKNQLICSYDNFSINSRLNQIIRTTAFYLLKADVSQERKSKLKKLLLYFQEIDIITPSLIQWNIKFNRNTQTYQMLYYISYLTLKGLLQTETDGTLKMKKVLDDQKMCRLYEKFLLEYYKKEYPQFKVSAPQIAWITDDNFSDFLPTMQSDITIVGKTKTLIIDAKYYSKTMQSQYEKKTIHSNNLYQIFAYVKNHDSKNTGNVEGLVLYAKTDEVDTPNTKYQLSGNKIAAKTLDLNCDFSKIKEQLNVFVSDL